MSTALEKIASALDCVADDLDAAPVAPAGSPPDAPKTASSADLFREVFRRQTGEEPPAAFLDKLAAADDPETQAVIGRLLKTAAPERPTPLGEPSEMRSADAAPANGAESTKLAWDAFEDAIIGGGNHDD